MYKHKEFFIDKYFESLNVKLNLIIPQQGV